MPTGGCLCNAVRYEITGRISPVQLCHCARCRRASGSAFMAQVACRTGKIRFVAGADLVREIELEVVDEPPGYTRSFCGRCGSLVPTVREGTPYASIPAGSLDEAPGTHVFRQIFTADKASWWRLDETIESYPKRLPPELRLPRE